MHGRIDYRMAKRAVIRQVTRGLIGQQEVCDAHPELLRAARNVGTETSRTCPICRMADDRADIPIDPETTLRELTYLYGPSLRKRQGMIAWDQEELHRIVRRHPSVTAYTVECCLTCGWNHLVSSELHGTDHVPGKGLRPRMQNDGG